KLAQRRHFPSINWLTSYSLYNKTLENWYATNVNPQWSKMMSRIMAILQEEEKLLEIVQLVGSDALPEKQQLTLEVARMIREFFLQQNAYHEIDTYCEPKKTYMLAETILYFADKAYAALEEGAAIPSILNTNAKEKIANVKFVKDYEGELNRIKIEMDREFSKLEG
ncbi:MAG: V-type ATP synthase subunit A, partial [Candidatus Woesearchaeota archaeon]|nr:V-type ATP synthase subunit A [Candidatus Woesearchaeota archaeon]